MNRLQQLKKTLLQNILDNKYYKKLEFVVLDYNSCDGMEEWAKTSLKKYILSGRLIYYKTTDPVTFNHSHAKNILFKLATGAIVCNINADHFVGENFADYVNSMFNLEKNIFLTTIDFHKSEKQFHPAKDVFGKICVRKKDFLQIRGFDERMTKYGFEDYDFANRLEIGCRLSRTFIKDPLFLKFISHTDEERFSLESRENLEKMYVSYCTPWSSEIILLYKDFTFEKGTLIDSTLAETSESLAILKKGDRKFDFTLKEGEWLKGKWEETKNNDSLRFLPSSKINFSLLKDKQDTNDILLDSKRNVIFYRSKN
jgi:hypothetical protein